jgi:hypothetical protein
MTQELRCDETELIGSWDIRGRSVVADGVSLRIDALTNSLLKEVAVSDDGWATLYVDPKDGRYWELTYPDNESHGGGAPKLSVLLPERAKLKYHGIIGPSIES